MKPRPANQNTVAMTLTEVLVGIAVLVVLAVLFLPVLATSKYKRSRIGCISDLRQLGIAYRVWADDNGGKYPMQISNTNGGTMELAVTGNVAATFQIMSNQLDEPALLICPEDSDHFAATNFSADFTARNISYFVGLDAMDIQPQTLLSGDDNFAVGGAPVKSGLLLLQTNTPITWTAARHKYTGNIGFADGSVQPMNAEDLQQALQQTGVVTNRLAIP